MPREKIPTTPSTKKAVARKKAVTVITTHASFVGPEHRSALIAEAAYFRAEKRGFEAGHEVEDWLAAEAEIDARLLRGADLGSQA